ncbi:DMT family transporter [Limibacter armeniacum]|uniref:DMT family transporter n=1 Tax=Limibacter armeniacum TaxID=466084 RepID=UPI002FE53B47
MFKDQLKLHFVVFLWGFTAILGKLISIDAVELVFYRTFLSAIGLAAVLVMSKKSNLLKMPPRAAGKLILTGSLVGLHWITFFAASKLSVSVCLAGIATCSLFTAFLEPLFKKEKIKSYEVMLGLIVIGGLYVIFRFEFGHSTALGIALISSLLSATFSVMNSKFTKVYESSQITFYEMVGGCLVCILLLPAFKHYFPSEDGVLLHIPGLEDMMYLIVLAGVCTVYAFYTCIHVLKKLTAFYVNLSINMEPVYGIILALILGEFLPDFQEEQKMTSGFYLGTLMILSSVLLYPVIKKVQRLRAAKTAA